LQRRSILSIRCCSACLVSALNASANLSNRAGGFALKEAVRVSVPIAWNLQSSSITRQTSCIFAILVNATWRLSQLPAFWLPSSSLIGELCLAIPEMWAQFQLCSGIKQWQDLGTWLAGQKLEQTPRLHKLSQIVAVNCSIKRKLKVVKFSCSPWPP